MIKTKAEIHQTLDDLGEDVHGLDGGTPGNWRADNFKYGYYCGKVDALGWVLCEGNDWQMYCNLDFEDYEKHAEDDRQMRLVDTDFSKMSQAKQDQLRQKRVSDAESALAQRMASLKAMLDQWQALASESEPIKNEAREL